MKTKRKKRFIRPLIFLALTGALVAGAVACKGHHHRHMTPERMKKMANWVVDDVLDDIEATDAQSKKIHAIKARLLQEGMALKKQHRAVRKAMRAELAKANPDAKTLHRLVDQQRDRMSTLAHKATDAVLQVHAILTPAQRAQLLERIDKKAGCHGDEEEK